jgi:predicted DNA-binding ribbon-helix-helix protein
MIEAGIVKRSVRIAGHQTSVSLEAEFWHAFQGIAARRGVSANALLAAIDRARRGNLSSAIRLFVLDTYRRGDLGSAPEPDGGSVVSNEPASPLRRSPTPRRQRATP